MSCRLTYMYRGCPKYLIAITVCFVLLYFLFTGHTKLPADRKESKTNIRDARPRQPVKSLFPNSTYKIILFHNAFPNYKEYNGDHVFKQCKTPSCYFTTNTNDLPESTAVIFQYQTMHKMPPTKKLGQIWIFTYSEPPGPTNDKELVNEPQWRDKFNWTFSYRRRSDFYFGYGDIIPRTKPVERNYSEIYALKNKTVGWIVSHCPTYSKREQYVKEMQKHIDVDIYGRCGNKQCNARYSGNENDVCHDMISKEYKFYLSFENNLCRDYTTEKFYFAYEFDKHIIPVARGSYNMKESVPKDAFLDAFDFQSPKDLATCTSNAWLRMKKNTYVC